MANKRELKKCIHLVCGDLLSECMAMSLYESKKDDESIKAIMRAFSNLKAAVKTKSFKDLKNIKAIISSILGVYANSISRVSHPQQGMKPKLYFKDLKDKFEQEICEIIDVMGNL